MPSVEIRNAIYVIMLFFLLIIIGPIFYPYDIMFSDLSLRLQPPSFAHPMGMDASGNDVLRAVLSGGQTSLWIALTTVTLCSIVGVSLGMIAATSNSLLDTIIMRTVDVFMTFPGILPAMVVASLLEPSAFSLVLAMSLTGWTGSTRLIRSQAQSMMQKDFIQAAHALGCSKTHLIIKHLFPNCLTPFLIHATFSLSSVILTESSLTFLGFGPQEGAPSWGALLNEGRSVLMEAPHLSMIPGGMIMFFVLYLNFLGDGLRDYLDPKHK
ncbi:MAG: ABC transporter permease [Oligoflexales bacterium]